MQQLLLIKMWYFTDCSVRFVFKYQILYGEVRVSVCLRKVLELLLRLRVQQFGISSVESYSFRDPENGWGWSNLGRTFHATKHKVVNVNIDIALWLEFLSYIRTITLFVEQNVYNVSCMDESIPELVSSEINYIWTFCNIVKMIIMHYLLYLFRI